MDEWKDEKTGKQIDRQTERYLSNYHGNAM